jgi:hypothetical protein
MISAVWLRSDGPDLLQHPVVTAGNSVPHVMWMCQIMLYDQINIVMIF